MRRLNWRLIAVATAFAGAPFLARASELPELPKLNLSGYFPAIRRQVQQADAAARAHPRSAGASGTLGMVLDTYKEYESAALCYDRAHRLDPRSFRWAYYLGSAQVHQGKYDQAVVALREALRLSANYLPARLKLADSLLESGELDESKTMYDDILKTTPDSAEALYGLGRIATARGETSAAVDDYLKACGIFPNFGAAQYALALAYRRLGKADEAQPHFSLYEANMTVTPPLADPLMGAVQALDLGAEPHLDRSIELAQQGRILDAIRENEQALAIDPKNVQAHINLISLYARAGQPQKAEQNFQAAVRLNPNRADAYYNGGVLLVNEGKYLEGEEAFRQAVRINPYYAEAHNNLGYLLERQGQSDDALAEYEAAIKDRPDYRLAQFHVATILLNRKQYDEAIQHLLTTLSPEDEDTPKYLYALGIAYGRSGNLESALKYIRMARDQAAARKQTELLANIDKDLRTLEQDVKQ